MKSILISCATRLAPFDIKELRELTEYDEMDIEDMGSIMFTCEYIHHPKVLNEMPKTVISYRKPRRLSEEQKNKAKERMARINLSKI